MKTTYVLGAGVAKLVQCQGYVTDSPGVRLPTGARSLSPA